MTNNSVSIRLVLSFAALAVVAAAGVLRAGPINPPAGPVASTAKPLAEIEPRIAISAANTPGDADSMFKITQPGSYYLTGNITGVVGKHGIEIASSGVTLDLMGFDLSGIPAMGAFDGVSTTLSDFTNISIRNGSVRGWGDEGVDLGAGTGVINSAVVDVRSSGNAGHGIAIGIGCSITGCTAYQNIGFGISTNTGSTITGCTASGNGNGFLTGVGCTITGCTAAENISSGIRASDGSTISNCTARFNGVDGILVSGSCLVLANTCFNNGNVGLGAGIHATGPDNRIEGNNCTNADRGIDIDVAGNIIIKNSCSGNTIDWVIVANNVFGPIIDRRAPASAAVSGFTAASTLGSTDPNANFSY